MNEHPIKDLMGITLEKLKEMVDVDTIIGKPISLPDGITIIPVSKLSLGFASGGSDLPTTKEKELFGGGSGGGVSVQPVAFITINNGEIKLLQMSAPKEVAIINSIPEIANKLSDIFSKNNNNSNKKN
ncbi:MAG: GerW family sporulation protein [Bacteroidales bacterium]|jgi:sporulation protein YtfJ|nr:GerW family sporulation protein [Bacteroidales bacterium]